MNGYRSGYYDHEEHEDSLPEKIRGYDWYQAFAYADDPVAVTGAHVSTASFDRADVKEVIATSEGEHDGANWVGVFELRDGRFASLSAGCDYTGWDCQAGGDSHVAGTREDIIKFGLDVGERDRLGLLLPGEEV